MTAIFRITDGLDRVAGINLLSNTSFETNTADWGGGGTNTIARSTEQSKFGKHSLRATYQDNLSFIFSSAFTLTANIHVFSAWVYIPADWDGGVIRVAIGNFTGVVTNRAAVQITDTEVWRRTEIIFTLDAGDLTGNLFVQTSSAPTVGKHILIDGLQLEQAPTQTLYMDGDQQFCTWNGTPHASTSTRSAFTGTSVQFVGDNRRDGLYLKEIRPQAAAYKDGGTYVSSPLADSRRLVDTKYENVIETLELVARNADQDSYAETMRNARFLLKKAADYWTTSWATEPVWIEAKGLNETNMRYALAMNGAVPEDDNPWGMPFINPIGIISKEISLIIERLHWMSNPPRIGTATQISAVESYPICGASAPNGSTDDGSFQAPATAQTALTELWIGDGITLDENGILFRNTWIPQGATIVSAFIRFVASQTLSLSTVNALISGEVSLNPLSFSTYADFSGRVKTTNTVAWSSIPSWTAGTAYDTPDISTIIEEIVAQSGWNRLIDDNIVIFVDDNGSTGAQYRTAAAYDNVTYDEPVLHVCYTT